MKRLFAFMLAFLLTMSSAILVTAVEENASNPLSAAIEEICSNPWKIESLSFSINPGQGTAEPFWKNYSYFTKDKESLLEAAWLLSKLEVTTEGETVDVSDACTAFLEIKMKDGRIFKLAYNDKNSIFYNGREYCGSIYGFADALYDTRMNEEPNSIVMPISVENGYTVDLREFDVSRITYTERYDDGTKRFMIVEDHDSIDKLIRIMMTDMYLTYDAAKSEIPENSAILTVEYDDSFLDTDVLYILPGSIDGKNVTNGRVWYEDKEYALDTLIFDGFERELESIASSESKVYESNSVLYDCVTGDAEISAIGYERCAKEEGKKNGYYDFFTVVRDTEYIDDIAEQFKSAKVVDISEDTPFKTNMYYTETVKLMYEDGSVRKIVIDGNKLFYDGKEYRIYGLSDIYATVCEETHKARPALECYGEVYDLAIWGIVYSIDGEYWFNGRPSGKKGTVTEDELDFDTEDVDTANYIMWLLNSSAMPYDDSTEISPSLDGGTKFYMDTDIGAVIGITFCKDSRVILSTGEHRTPDSVGSYMLPYDTAIEIFNIILDASDGQLESVEDVEAATDALIDEFYEKCERIGEEADEDKLVGIFEDDVYTVRYINLRHSADGTKSRKIYDIEGVSNCEKILNELKKVGFTPSDKGIAFGDGASVDYTKILLTDINGYTTELLIYPTTELLRTAKKGYTFDKNRLWSFERFIDGFENKTVVDPYADDMKGTALADGIAALLSNPSEIQSFSFTAEIRGGVARSKDDAPYNFSYMTSDSAYINEAVKLLAGCEFSKKPETHEKVGYTDVTVKFNTANGVLELHAYSNGKVSYNGTYYGYLGDMCKEVYKLRAKEAGDSFIVKSGIAGKYDIDLFSKDVTRLVYHGIDMGAVAIDDAEKIEKIGVYAAKYITLTGFQRVNSDAAGGVQPETFTVEYANGKKSKIYFKRPFGNNNIIIEGDALQYSVPSSDFYTFRRFFEVYAKYDSIKISNWAKPELEKAVLYGFTGIDKPSDDYKRALTRGETCDVLMWPVKDIIGIWDVKFDAPPYQDSVTHEGVYILTVIDAVEGKETDGITFRYFKQDDLLTREELSKIVVGIYTSDEYRELLGDTSEFKLPDVAETSFNDDSEISDWAKPYVEKAKELGIFKGDDKGNFNPKGNCTKEEVVAVAVRLYEMMLKNIED